MATRMASVYVARLMFRSKLTVVSNAIGAVNEQMANFVGPAGRASSDVFRWQRLFIGEDPAESDQDRADLVAYAAGSLAGGMAIERPWVGKGAAKAVRNGLKQSATAIRAGAFCGQALLLFSQARIHVSFRRDCRRADPEPHETISSIFAARFPSPEADLAAARAAVAPFIAFDGTPFDGIDPIRPFHGFAIDIGDRDWPEEADDYFVFCLKYFGSAVAQHTLRICASSSDYERLRGEVPDLSGPIMFGERSVLADEMHAGMIAERWIEHSDRYLSSY